MNIQSIKRLTWLGAFGLGGALGWDVWQFLENKGEYEKYVSTEEIERALMDRVQEPESVDPNPTVKVKDLTSVFFNLNWTGKAERPVVLPDREAPVVAQPKVAVADLLKVQYVGFSEDPEESMAFVEFLDGELQTLMDDPSDHLLKVGEHLAGKYEHVEVARIEPNGVLFKFGDPQREPELVEYSPFESGGVGIVVVGEEGVLQPRRDTIIRPASAAVSRRYRRPKSTELVGRNEYQIGTETLQTFDRDYSRILAEDLRYKNAVNPLTGKFKGIQVTQVASGSLPAQHGISAGEILISINGHRVTGLSDAVAYVKKEAGTQSTWVALFEKDGRQFTRTYHSPEE